MASSSDLDLPSGLTDEVMRELESIRYIKDYERLETLLNNNQLSIPDLEAVLKFAREGYFENPLKILIQTTLERAQAVIKIAEENNLYEKKLMELYQLINVAPGEKISEDDFNAIHDVFSEFEELDKQDAYTGRLKFAVMDLKDFIDNKYRTAKKFPSSSAEQEQSIEYLRLLRQFFKGKMAALDPRSGLVGEVTVRVIKIPEGPANG